MFFPSHISVSPQGGEGGGAQEDRPEGCTGGAGRGAEGAGEEESLAEGGPGQTHQAADEAGGQQTEEDRPREPGGSVLEEARPRRAADWWPGWGEGQVSTYFVTYRVTV